MRWTGRSGFRTHLMVVCVGCLFVLVSLSPRAGLCQEKTQLFIDEVRFKNFPAAMQETVEPWGSALAAEVSGALEGAPHHSPVTLENLKAQLGKERLKATMACEDSNCVNRIVENFGCSATVFPVVRFISTEKAQVSVTHTADGEKVASRGPMVVPPTYESLAGALRSLSRDVMGLPKSKNGGFVVTPHAPIPEVTGPSEFRGDVGGMSFGDVDLQELKAYDEVARFDKSGASPREKARRWDDLATAHPTYRDQALARAAEWRAYARKHEASEQARKARAAAMAKDWNKLSQLIDLSVVSDEDKWRWAGEFVKAYGSRAQDNPHLDALKPWLGGGGSIEWVSSKPAGISFARSETTVSQYRACVDAGKCESKHHRDKAENKYCNWGHEDRDDHPMNCVEWYGAKQFCEWAGGRLPTEQEWESEAGAGGSRAHPWGSETPSCSRCVMDDGSTRGSAGSETDGCGEDHTWPVCSKRRGDSVSGVCDMAGNVWEWTSSQEGSSRVLRGGSWSFDAADLFRASSRGRNSPDFRSVNYGFRCVRSSQ